VGVLTISMDTLDRVPLLPPAKFATLRAERIPPGDWDARLSPSRGHGMVLAPCGCEGVYTFSEADGTKFMLTLTTCGRKAGCRWDTLTGRAVADTLLKGL
jgi:hypothetical protein